MKACMVHRKSWNSCMYLIHACISFIHVSHSCVFVLHFLGICAFYRKRCAFYGFLESTAPTWTCTRMHTHWMPSSPSPNPSPSPGRRCHFYRGPLGMVEMAAPTWARARVLGIPRKRSAFCRKHRFLRSADPMVRFLEIPRKRSAFCRKHRFLKSADPMVAF